MDSSSSFLEQFFFLPITMHSELHPFLEMGSSFSHPRAVRRGATPLLALSEGAQFLLRFLAGPGSSALSEDAMHEASSGHAFQIRPMKGHR